MGWRNIFNGMSDVWKGKANGLPQQDRRQPINDTKTTTPPTPDGGSAWLERVNRERDDLVAMQKIGPAGLPYPILSLCCYYAESERIHKICMQKLYACPCHQRHGPCEST